MAGLYIVNNFVRKVRTYSQQREPFIIGSQYIPLDFPRHLTTSTFSLL
jgi:hypothetical protein